MEPLIACVFDPSKPATARVYDYWLGGKDNFAADREEARQLAQICPMLPRHARENRMFLGKAVYWLAKEGIRQFIDAGSGMPTAENTHHVAQAVDPSCRVAYVDNDPMVVSHASALLAGDPGVTAFWGDLNRPGDVIASQSMGKAADLSQPVAVVLALVLDFFDAGTACRIVSSFVDAVAPGSYIAISAGCWDEKIGSRLIAGFHAATLHNHSPEQIASFLVGLEMVEPPGLCDARHWLPGKAAPPPHPVGGRVLAAVARKAVA